MDTKQKMRNLSIGIAEYLGNNLVDDEMAQAVSRLNPANNNDDYQTAMKLAMKMMKGGIEYQAPKMKKDLSKFLDFKPYKQTKGEKYMSPKQIEHFKKILLDWKNLLMKEAEKTVENMKRDSTKLSDPNDAATQEEEFRLELRTRDRERKLIIKIDQALQRVDDGLYGYCEDTGEPIGIKRLEARPIATLCIEAQERHERLEKSQMD